MPKVINVLDYIGKKYGKLLILEGDCILPKLGQMVLVLCDCGNITSCSLKNMKARRVRTCGCSQLKGAKRNVKTHHLRHHPLYRIWANIKDRCHNPKCRIFHLYGGKGVAMCKEWFDNFKPFYDWAIGKWQIGLQIDKDILYKTKYGTDIGMVYSPEFCCFITPKENSNNKGNHRILCINGVEMNLTQATEMYNIPESTLYNRLKRGWDDTKAATTPRMTQYASN